MSNQSGNSNIGGNAQPAPTPPQQQHMYGNYGYQHQMYGYGMQQYGAQQQQQQQQLQAYGQQYMIPYGMQPHQYYAQSGVPNQYTYHPQPAPTPAHPDVKTSQTKTDPAKGVVSSNEKPGEQKKKGGGGRRGGKTKTNGRDNRRQNNNKGKKNKRNDDLYVPEKYRIAAQIGNTPEEIAKWREDRKKNFPTRANIERKKLLENEKDTSATGASSVPSSANEGPKLPAVLPNAVAEDRNSDLPDVTKTNQNALGMFMTGYDSSSSDGSKDGNVNTSTIPKASDAFHTEPSNENPGGSLSARGKKRKRVPKLCRHFSQGQCVKGDKCRYSHDTQVAMEAAKRKRNASVLQTNRGAMGRQPNGKDTLLRKLLEKDIRKERSLFLHCVRHLIETNFLSFDSSNA